MDALHNRLPLLLLAFVCLVVVFPLLRHRRATGQWAVIVRGACGPVERFVRGWLVALAAALAVWSAMVPVLGPATLGVRVPPTALASLGLGLVFLGAMIVVVAQRQMGASWRIGIDDAPTRLVTGGLFGLVRHPIYTGILTALLGLLSIAPSVFTAGAWLLMYFLVAIQSRLEDDHMAHQHGGDFVHWARRTGRLVPGLGRLRPGQVTSA